jgi:2-polyprenyl-3-methyl-5-hydroxy-6-metoxy-1,4-benzoquinol methylase
MKRTSADSPPYLSWTLITRNAETTLEAALKSLRERTPDAEIVVVDTMSSDSTPEIAKKYADVWVEWTGPRGDWTRDMPWFDDAAAARNHAMSLATGTWMAWADADDRVVGPDEAERLLKLNGRWKPATVNAKIVNGEVDSSVKGLAPTLEDALRHLEKMSPEADCVWAPYLYQRDENDQAMVWQVRERFIKRTPRWHWAEKAHEVLVPITGPHPPYVEFSHLLFVHEREFSASAVTYSMQRHFDVLHKQFMDNDITTRRCMYLAEYSKFLCPERELEFIRAAHEKSTTPLDRMRAQIMMGSYFAARGLAWDAVEAYGAATHLRPDLPDPWLAGAEAWVKIEDRPRAIEWLEKAVGCAVGGAETMTTPRHLATRYPTLLSEQYRLWAKDHVDLGQFDAAQHLYGRAVDTMRKVVENPAIGAERGEAENYYRRTLNEGKAHEFAMHVRDQVKFLLDNDEPLKAVELLKAMPWNLEDHPIVVALQDRLKYITKHVTDAKAYVDFYRNDFETGYIPSPTMWLDPAKSLGRARWAADWITTNAPKAKVLDVGCFDGIIGIPLLQLAPEIEYVGVDPYQKSIDTFSKRTVTYGVSDRAALFIDPSLQLTELLKHYPEGSFDVVIWFEVIEHVQRPPEDMQRILRMLKPGGHLLVTTPEGSFDLGAPPSANINGGPRDNRGHLRALTVRDMAEIVKQTEGRLLDVTREALPENGPEEMRAVVRRELAPAAPKVVFAVPGALWKWNSRSVDAGGMGASEKTIVHLARGLAEGRPVEVYGPVPVEEVHHGVGYWRHEKMRHLKDARSFVVSRGPAFGPMAVEEWLANRPEQMILWLQDAHYEDLNPGVASFYDKIVVVSKWHGYAMHQRHGVPFEKMEVAYNFLQRELFENDEKIERKRDRFVYASSPDRGLIRLMELWPKIRTKLPDACLDIYYGWRGIEALGLKTQGTGWATRLEYMRQRFEQLVHQPGITHLGMVPARTLARAYRSAGVWLYPTTFEETGCSNACEARAAGCVPVCPPLAALSETGVCDEGFLLKDIKDDDEVVAAAVAATQVTDEARAKMSREAIAAYSLEALLPVWRNILK